MYSTDAQVLALSVLAIIGIGVAVWAAIRRRRQIVVTLTAAGCAIVCIMILATLNTTIANSITLLATLAAAAIAVASFWQTRDLEERRAREAMLNRILDWVNEAMRVKATYTVSTGHGLFDLFAGSEKTSQDWFARRDADRKVLLAKKAGLLKEVERLCHELPEALPLKTEIAKIVSMLEDEDFCDWKLFDQIDEQYIVIVTHISNLRAQEGL